MFTDFKNIKYVYVITSSAKAGYKLTCIACSQLYKNMHGRKEQIPLKS